MLPVLEGFGLGWWAGPWVDRRLVVLVVELSSGTWGLVPIRCVARDGGSRLGRERRLEAGT